MIKDWENTTRLYIKDDFREKYFVYGVYDNVGKVKFIWYDRLCDIITLKSLKKTDYFNPNIIYEIYLIKYFDNKIDAENALSKIIDESELEGKTPPYNLKFRNYSNRYRILCIETGFIYNSALETARIMGLSTSALSAHLNRQTGYKTIKGFRFIYTNAPHFVKQLNVCGKYDQYDTLPKLHHYSIEGEK